MMKKVCPLSLMWNRMWVSLWKVMKVRLLSGLKNKDVREVGAFLMKMIDAVVGGHAKEVLISMGNPGDRDGSTTINILADVYGRKGARVAVLPMLSAWSRNNIQ